MTIKIAPKPVMMIQIRINKPRSLHINPFTRATALMVSKAEWEV